MAIRKGFSKLVQLQESCIELGDNSTDSEEFEQKSFSSEEETKERENIGDEDNESEDEDQLNSSDIYPLENPTTFSDNIDCESYITYLQVKFIEDSVNNLIGKSHIYPEKTREREK